MTTCIDILIVEDDAMSQRLLVDVLAYHGYAVQAVDRAEDAMGILENCQARLLLLDIQLPGINGFEMLSYLRTNPAWAAIPVVAVTASVMDYDRRKIRSAGFDDYLPKPVDLGQLLALVSRYVQAAHDPRI